MVPKADSGAFLLLFLLVLTVTEPLRPGARGGGGRGGRPGAGRTGPGSPRTSLHSVGPYPGRTPPEAYPRSAASSFPGPCTPRTMP